MSLPSYRLYSTLQFLVSPSAVVQCATDVPKRRENGVAFPEAKLWQPAALRQKESIVQFTVVLSSEDFDKEVYRRTCFTHSL